MPVETTENYVRIRARDPGDFEEGSLRTITLSAGEGIKAVVGRLKGETKTTIQTYLFDKDKWTTEKAQAWVAEHKGGKAWADLMLGDAYKAEGAREKAQAAKAISYDDLIRLVRDAWLSQFSGRIGAQPQRIDDSWPEAVFEDHIIVRTPDGLYSYSYQITDDKVQFGEPVKVEIDYKPAKSLAVKMLSEDDQGVTVGGYLLLWGDAKHKDLQDQYFTKTSELWLDKLPVVPALFHHGLDSTVDLAVVGQRIKAQMDDRGVWVKHWLDKSNEYWTWIEPLLRAEALYLSPGSAGHLVRIDAKSGEILAYPVVEDTLTPIPAQHRLRPVEQIKAAYKSANLAEPALSGDGAGAPCPDAERERARAAALRVAIELGLSRLELD